MVSQGAIPERHRRVLRIAAAGLVNVAARPGCRLGGKRYSPIPHKRARQDGPSPFALFHSIERPHRGELVHLPAIRNSPAPANVVIALDPSLVAMDLDQYIADSVLDAGQGLLRCPGHLPKPPEISFDVPDIISKRQIRAGMEGALDESQIIAVDTPSQSKQHIGDGESRRDFINVHSCIPLPHRFAQQAAVSLEVAYIDVKYCP